MALVLRDALVWDGESAEPQRVDVSCADGLVSSVDPAGSAAAADDDVCVDFAGAFVLPGLIDAHVHLVWSGGPDPARQVAAEGEQLTTLRAGAHAVSQLQSGVTTLRDLGGNWDVAISVSRAVDRGALEGPTIIAAGRTVIMTGGHDSFWGVPADGADAVVRAVRGQVDRGAGVIKTAATGGVYGRAEGEEVDDSELTYEELRALVVEAHRRGRRVAAHALGTEGIRNAVHAGVDTVEHGVFLTDDIVEQMRERRTVLCPTTETYRRIAGAAQTGDAPAYAARKAIGVVEGQRESLQMAIEAGIPVIAGTDAGAPGMPHPTLVDELECLVSYGLSTHDALRAATSAAADALGLGSVGRVRPGARADLVVLDADPFASVSALRKIWGVVRAERFVRGGAGRQ